MLTNLTIKLFNKAIPGANTIPFDELNKVAVKHGYLVHPDLCNTEVLNWLNDEKRDYNSTFYKKWSDVISKSRFELYIDQLLHYASTYGTDFAVQVYLPEGEVIVPPFSEFKVITVITKEEVITRCEKLLFSGIALKQETIEDVINILSELQHTVDVSLVRNKEAKMFLYQKLNQLPKDATEMVRYLVYLATAKTLLIKDRATYEAIKGCELDISGYVSKFGYEKLASVFYRFKPLFLAFRDGVENNKVCINRLRRLAVKNHKPLQKTYFEQLLSKRQDISELPEKLKNISCFKKIALLQTINIRLKQLENRAFVVRNQKLFIKSGQVSADRGYYDILYKVIYSDLVKSLSGKACKVKIPKGLNITLPTSEKSFIGNFPIGTSFDFSDSNNIVGINWKGADGADDLDLKLINTDGSQYGWNAGYYNENNSIIFSGDMTSADPEATELFYTSKGFNPCIVKVNLYRGEPKSKFRFFLAKEKITNLKQNYMVNPSNILFTVDCEMDSKEKSLGVISDNKFILAQFRTGKGAVAYKSVTELYTDYALSTLDCYLSLQQLLKDSGFTIVKENADIDLSNLSKDTLIDLLASEKKNTSTKTKLLQEV